MSGPQVHSFSQGRGSLEYHHTSEDSKIFSLVLYLLRKVNPESNPKSVQSQVFVAFGIDGILIIC